MLFATLLLLVVLCALFGVVYPVLAVLTLRILGDRRPLRDLLNEI